MKLIGFSVQVPRENDSTQTLIFFYFNVIFPNRFDSENNI